MKSFSALVSFAALTLVLLRVEVLASPTPSQDFVDDSPIAASREPTLPGTVAHAGEVNYIAREAEPYGRDRHHRYSGYHRDLEDPAGPDNQDQLKREVQHHGHHHHHHHHHHSKSRREEDSVGALDRRDGEDSFEGALDSETPVKREGGYYGRHHRNRHYHRDSEGEGYYGHHHRHRHDRRGDADSEEGGYYGHHHRHHHDRRDDADSEEGGYYGRHYRHRHDRREDADSENSFIPLVQAKREEGYFGHHHHHHRHFLRDGDTVGIPLEEAIEGRSHNQLHGKEPKDEILITRDVAEQDVDQHHRHHRYPKDTEHRGWRHHRKYYRREDVEEMPSELDLQSMVERAVEHHHRHHHKYPRDDDSEEKKKKDTAEDVKEGVTHGVGTGIKESVGGFLGLDL